MARFAGVRGLTDGFDALVEQCLSEYDLDGWAGGPWLDGGDSRAGGAGG
jgi:hypothetical protein